MSSIDLHCAHAFQLLDKNFISSIFDKHGHLHHFRLTSEGMSEVGSCHRHISSYIHVFCKRQCKYIYTHIYIHEHIVYIHSTYLFSNVYIYTLELYIYIYIYIHTFYIYMFVCDIYVQTVFFFKTQFQRSGFHEHSKTCSKRSENFEMMSLPEFFVEVETQQPLSPSPCLQFPVKTESCLQFRCIYRGMYIVAILYIYIYTYSY